MPVSVALSPPTTWRGTCPGDRWSEPQPSLLSSKERAGRVGLARGSWGREPGWLAQGRRGARREEQRPEGRDNRPLELGVRSSPVCISGKQLKSVK